MSGVTVSTRFDVQSLLDPIPGVRRAGESLRYEGTYDRISEARREDDRSISQGIYQTRLKRADWAAAEAICVAALESRTKDLQIAGWLMEAWLQLYGFSGVEAGLNLLSGLCQNFWDDLYPSLDAASSEAGLEDRIAPFEWINEKLRLRLKQIPLTLPSQPAEESYSFADWENACHMENLARRDPSAMQETMASLKPGVEGFRTAVFLTETSLHVEMVKDLEDAVSACGFLQQLLDEKCGKYSPSLYQFNEILVAIQQLLTESLHGREEIGPLVEQDPASLPGITQSEQDIEIWGSGPITSRADAYRRLSEAADYLLRTEPHSPTPYLVRRAVEWGNMNLFELLQQIVRNDDEMKEIDKLLRLTGRKVADMK
jgi:type VI secretion system ImpA family protein